MNLKDLNLSKETETIKTESGIQVKKTIPSSDKIDLVQIALQKAEEDGIYNQIKLDIYFHLNIIYLYTNLEIDLEDREDEMELYDILENNGIIAEVIAAIGEYEYTSLKDYLIEIKNEKLRYENTAAAVLNRIVHDLPKNAAAAKEIVDSFDKDQYQQVIDFATAANGGRNINTNAAPVKQEKVPVSTAAPQSSSTIEQTPKKVVKIKSATKKD